MSRLHWRLNVGDARTMLSRNGWNTEAAARFEGSSIGSPEADSSTGGVAPAAKMKHVTAQAAAQVNRVRAICAWLLLEYPDMRALLRRDHTDGLLFCAGRRASAGVGAVRTDQKMTR